MSEREIEWSYFIIKDNTLTQCHILANGLSLSKLLAKWGPIERASTSHYRLLP